MTHEIDQVNQNDDQLLEHQLTIIFEYLINTVQFDLPYILVLLDKTDNVIGSKIIGSDEDGNVLNAADFVSSEGVEDGLLYPMHVMVRDTNGSVAYVYLDHIDAQPEVQIVRVDEDE